MMRMRMRMTISMSEYHLTLMRREWANRRIFGKSGSRWDKITLDPDAHSFPEMERAVLSEAALNYV